MTSPSKYLPILLFVVCISSCEQDKTAPESGSLTTEESSTPPIDEELPKLTPPKPIQAADVPVEDEKKKPENFAYHNPLTDSQKADGWLSLFDGLTLFGWESTSDEINWDVKDGTIVADSGPIGILMTTLPFADYELVCEYRIEKGGNSGLFLRTEFPSGDIATQCYEINIADEHPDGFTTGSLVNRAKLKSPVERKDDWNEFRVILNGAHAKIIHNGEEVLDYTADNNVADSGRIGLQKNAGKIEFRKVIVKPLNLQSIFNGKDLTGWRDVPGSKSEFKVVENEIRVKNGQGFIETEKTYQDFIFQSQAISHAAELNSGFFFRAMAGTEKAPSFGYEYQIHNGFNSDRSHPSNAGTGGIFRRVEARYVVANDKEWFTATLIAYGPRIGCWVDGYHVVDWVDDRKPDPNPRRGQRLEGGHISIQGHDPTTDLSFKNLRIVEYPKATANDE
jgi:hypothetical protein